MPKSNPAWTDTFATQDGYLLGSQRAVLCMRRDGCTGCQVGSCRRPQHLFLAWRNSIKAGSGLNNSRSHTALCDSVGHFMLEAFCQLFDRRVPGEGVGESIFV